jgi:hypothetical protein
MTSAYLSIKNIYLPQVDEKTSIVPGIINLVLTLSIMICVVIIFSNALPKWLSTYRERNSSQARIP